MNQHRAFGREITNIHEEPQRQKRNYSFFPHELNKEVKPLEKPSNRMPSKSVVQINRSVAIDIEKTKLTEQMVPQYFSDNLQFMKDKERNTYKLFNYIATHETVSENSRAKLIDWLSELHYKLKMFPETIFTMVGLLDTYLMQQNVQLGKLQLVGVAVLFIAAKFQQTYQVPQLRQLVGCCAGQYSAEQILKMEGEIVHALGFQLIIDSAYKFFEPLAKVIGLESKNYHLAQYVLELSMLQPKFLQYSPSLLASSAIYLIKKIRKSQSRWDQFMTSVIGYQQNQIKSCAKQLCALLEKASELQNCKSIKKKFSSPAFHEVTRIKLERKK